ncbi:hypothetical protein [Pseudomonas oryzihabitans]|uniref:hypothetical protein n=1 Tax=Pseudomonas oryzihabitans TaxID=47885 RepID=UPI0011A5EB96|nr:hypothetical protein [Pseudomonas oryzihabitans]QEU01955.1 hypothetical protein FOB65_01055 [Pseudomonas oryzihabitans]
MNSGPEKYDIKCELLYGLMTYGDGSVENPLRGNWNTWHFGSRGILTWIVMEALDIKRYPWHPDITQCIKPQSEDSLEILRYLTAYLNTEEKVQDLIDEMRRIYDFTQDSLLKSGKNYIHLFRSLNDGNYKADEDNKGGYASNIVKLSKAAIQLKRESFKIAANVLTSWDKNGGYANNPVAISMDHPIRNIVWTSDLIATKSNYPYSPAVESGEWVVVNRSLDGKLSVPAINVTCKKTLKNMERLEAQLSRLKNNDELAVEWLDRGEVRLEPFLGYTEPHLGESIIGLCFKDRLRLALDIIFPRK